ncbi:hypothetical protein BDW02DRAFT_569484 [Decorospora gaudefroyi]|uniref:Uncharacterized protein n=1 Tax=Decorospora gaudefroyi TaxID=184978 RepID=A0A6A5KCX6_9PLEO|nr:hypothetical protein BDW02DRAFT_569484 [Decorospora gaudefroyi]
MAVGKKRGRPAKAQAEEVVAVVDEAPKAKKRGRPSLSTAQAVMEEVVEAAPKRRPGRPRKEHAVAQEPPATPKRGRPARTAALQLNRVAGSPRVAKRTSPRSKATKPVVGPPRLDPRIRSRLRARLPPAKKTVKEEPVAPKPAKRGRPRKAPVEPAPASNRAAVEKATKRPKPQAPRKMRGHTVRQIPDKFLGLVDQFLQELIEAKSSSDAVSVGEEAVQADQVAIELQQQEDMDVHDEGRNSVLMSSEQDRDQDQDQEDFSDSDMVLPQGDGAENEDEEVQVLIDENGEPVEEVEIDMNMQKTVHMEQNGVAIDEEVDTEMVVHDHGHGPPDIFDEEDGYVRETSRSSAAAILG